MKKLLKFIEGRIKLMESDVFIEIQGVAFRNGCLKELYIVRDYIKKRLGEKG